MKDRFNTTPSRTYIGIAAEDKEKNSRELKVYIPDLLPFLEGDLNAAKCPVEITMKDRQIQQYRGNSNLTNYIVCQYRDMTSNRYDPPDVVRGEQVEVYQLSDSPIYYWFSLGRDDNLRKNEHMRIAISSNPDVGGERDDTNTYSITMDSYEEKQAIIIKTSKANGEKFIYTIRLDAKSGRIHICDDVNNEIEILSAEKQIVLRNGDGSIVNIDKKNISLNAVDELILKAGKQVIVQSPLCSINTVEGGGVTEINTKSFNANAAIKATMTSSSIGLNGKTFCSKQLKVKSTCIASGYDTQSISMGDLSIDPGLS